jgi:hypothetical protein
MVPGLHLEGKTFSPTTFSMGGCMAASEAGVFAAGVEIFEGMVFNGRGSLLCLSSLPEETAFWTVIGGRLP